MEEWLQCHTLHQDYEYKGISIRIHVGKIISIKYLIHLIYIVISQKKPLVLSAAFLKND
jgi:hypothetical protein